MKKTLLINLIICVLIFISCGQSKENKAHKLIDEHLKGVLNDYKSYETVEYSKFESIYYHHELEINEIKKRDSILLSDFKHIITCVNIYDILYKQKDKQLFETSTYTMAPSEINEIVHLQKSKYDRYKHTVDSLALLTQPDYKKIEVLKKMKPEFVGFEMRHKFRAKNKMGAYVLAEYKYSFDKDITHISTIETLDNN